MREPLWERFVLWLKCRLGWHDWQRHRDGGWWCAACPKGRAVGVTPCPSCRGRGRENFWDMERDRWFTRPCSLCGGE